jgi:hypothetical protein
MTIMDNRPLTDDMLARLAVTHKPTYEYITVRRANGVPTKGRPVKQPEPTREYRAPRISKEMCAAEFWKTCVDLAFTSRANPDYEQVVKELETWRRFATHPNAFN